MKFKIKPYSIFELGQRKNQEDCIFPKEGEATDNDRLFILCDGMGGHENGEVASQAVCQAMSQSIFSKSPDAEAPFNEDMLKDALKDALDKLDSLDTNPEATTKKMGTTMTFLKLHDGGATIAHIGDSRVYQIRPGQNRPVFVTRDHSLVNDLIKIGEMTEEEARHSKQKNVITRAMMPNLERRPKADIYTTTDIQSGDYFFLCSDGMLEQMEDENLCFILGKSDATDEEKVNMLINSSNDSRDNHSAHIIHILEVTGSAGVSTKTEPADKTSADDSEDIEAVMTPHVSKMKELTPNNSQQLPTTTKQQTSDPEPIEEAGKEEEDETAQKKNRLGAIFSVMFIIIILIGAGVFFLLPGLMHNSNEQNEPEKGKIENTDTTRHVPQQRQSNPSFVTPTGLDKQNPDNKAKEKEDASKQDDAEAPEENHAETAAGAEATEPTAADAEPENDNPFAAITETVRNRTKPQPQSGHDMVKDKVENKNKAAQDKK